MSSLGWVSGILLQSEQSLSSQSAPSKWNSGVIRPWATANSWPPSSSAITIQEDGDTLFPKPFPFPHIRAWEMVVGTSHSCHSPSAAPNSKAKPLRFTNISARYNFPVPLREKKMLMMVSTSGLRGEKNPKNPQNKTKNPNQQQKNQP